jgi:hypothetical protein
VSTPENENPGGKKYMPGLKRPETPESRRRMIIIFVVVFFVGLLIIFTQRRQGHLVFHVGR